MPHRTTHKCSFEIVGYVDAQNGFGAMIRSPYVAKLTRDKNDYHGWWLDMVEIL
jgi:hypothetical protein